MTSRATSSDRGQQITVVTDNNGDADFYLGIKGSDDFDDDGEAE